jgi:hypothetical protein
MLVDKSENDNRPLGIYKNNRFYQDTCKQRYDINDLNILYDDNILLLIYACEWFKIKDSNVHDKVLYHPYLTVRDHSNLNKIYQHYKNNLIFETVGVASIFYILKKKYVVSKKFRKTWKPVSAMALGMILIPYFSWNYIFKKQMNNEIRKNERLGKYLYLDLEKEKLRNELLNYNIVIKF